LGIPRTNARYVIGWKSWRKWVETDYTADYAISVENGRFVWEVGQGGKEPEKKDEKRRWWRRKRKELHPTSEVDYSDDSSDPPRSSTLSEHEHVVETTDSQCHGYVCFLGASIS
jgi:hypothetical protein